MSNKEAKKRHFDKVYNSAPLVLCACGCGQQTKSKDRYARDKKFINGHNKRIYDDPKLIKINWNHRNRKARFLYKKQWLKKLKINLINYKGGKCRHCSYTLNDTNEQAFDFHHVDSSNKLFTISSSLNRYSLQKIYEEVDKCELLCAICHRIYHSK